MGRITRNVIGTRPRNPDALPLQRHIGEQLLKARQDRQVTQQEVADAISTSRCYLGMIENGHHAPSAMTLWKLSCYFQCPVSYFFNGYEE